MGQFIARAFLWFILAIFLFYTTKEFNRLFTLSINPYFVVIPAVFLYGCQEYMMKKWKAKKEVDPTNAAIESKFEKVFYVIAGFLAVCLFLGILIVWAGVIYKEITR